MTLSNARQRHKLQKNERLYLRNEISTVFAEGKAFIAYPLRVLFVAKPAETAGIAMLCSVAKRRFKFAHQRNRIKRLIREAYRCDKHVLLDCAKSKGIMLHIAFVMVASQQPSLTEMQLAIRKALKRIHSELTKEDSALEPKKLEE